MRESENPTSDGILLKFPTTDGYDLKSDERLWWSRTDGTSTASNAAGICPALSYVACQNEKQACVEGHWQHRSPKITIPLVRGAFLLM
jgi:hypothetical protein